MIFIHAFVVDNPLGIIIDPYYCHWSPFYNKSHSSHLLLIINIDYINKKYTCFDVHFNIVGYSKIDFDIVDNYSKEYLIVNLKNKNDIKLELIINKLRATLNDFDNILDIKKSELIKYFTFHDRKLLFPVELETSIPLITLMWIAEDKKNFSVLLKYIEDNIGLSIFTSVYELLSSSALRLV